MDIALQSVLIWFHVLLFGYWLGADLGVFFCDDILTRSELSLEERLRVRKIRRKLDMAPRSCIALILPIGFTLAVQYGSPITGGWLVLVWVLSLAWLASIWTVRLTVNLPNGRLIEKYDRFSWYGIGIAMLALGIFALVTGEPIVERWLAVKMALFGVMTLSACWILWAGDQWAPLFDMVRAGGDQAVEGERLMKINRIHAGSAAATLWFFVLLIAFVGATKPF